MDSLNAQAWRHVRARLIAAALVAAAGLTTFAVISLSSAPPAHSAVPHAAQQCSEPSSSQRDPSNPLALPTSPGGNPLNGAQFYVPGPRKGAAAGAIAQLVGLNPQDMPVSESWADFEQRLARGSIADKLAHDKGL